MLIESLLIVCLNSAIWTNKCLLLWGDPWPVQRSCKNNNYTYILDLFPSIPTNRSPSEESFSSDQTSESSNFMIAHRSSQKIDLPTRFHYIVMELCPMSLRDKIDFMGKKDYNSDSLKHCYWACKTFRGIMSGAKYLHQKGS